MAHIVAPDFNPGAWYMIIKEFRRNETSV